MKPTTSIAVSCKNVSSALTCGVPAGESVVMFCSPSWVGERAADLSASIAAGQLQLTDLSGTAIGVSEALGALLDLSNAAAALARALAATTSPVARAALQVAWNLDVAGSVVAAVRADTIVTGLASVGTTAPAVLAKLGSVVALVELGMFQEAAATVQDVEPDGYLTVERLSLYRKMLLSADALGG